jgi:hypothetical protein
MVFSPRDVKNTLIILVPGYLLLAMQQSVDVTSKKNIGFQKDTFVDTPQGSQSKSMPLSSLLVCTVADESIRKGVKCIPKEQEKKGKGNGSFPLFFPSL